MSKLFLLSLCYILISVAHGFSSGDDYLFLIHNNVCVHSGNTTTINQYTSLVKLKCYWNKYVDIVSDRVKLDKDLETFRKDKAKSTTKADSAEKKHDSIFEIEFIPSQVKKNDPKYQKIHSNLFKKMLVRGLSFRKLGIQSIDVDAFEASSCKKELERLDLSDNQLKRIDVKILENLDRLNTLSLAKNQLQFGENNFEHNKKLVNLDLSDNGLQYLPNNLFANLHDLVSIDLSNNELQSIRACTFNKLLINPLARKYFPTQVNLLNNQIECDCNIFYIERYLGIKLNLTCAGPEVYKDRQFRDLKDEDPSKRCQYKTMDKLCRIAANEDDSWIASLLLIVILIIIALILLFVSLVCFVKNTSLKKKLKALQQDDKVAKSNNEQKSLIADHNQQQQQQQQQANNQPAPAVASQPAPASEKIDKA